MIFQFWLIGGQAKFKNMIIYPKIENKNIGVGQMVKIPIILDTEGKEINALEIKIDFSKNLIFRNYFEGKSIIGLWIQKPRLENDQIVFSGIIPGGFNGRNFEIIELIFEAKESGIAQININDKSTILLNDGLGTKNNFLALKEELNISKEAKKEDLKIEDRYPPDDFKIYLAKDSNLFGGKYFISFDAIDKQSGIAYYEVSEKPISFTQIFHFKKEEKPDYFIKTESPYVLNDQTLASFVYVKAVDKAGNEKIEVLYPKNLIDISSLGLGLVFVLLFFVFVLKLKKWFVAVKK